MKKCIFCLTAALLLAGCSMSNPKYEAPESITIENTKYINKPFDKIWSSTSNQFFKDTFLLKSSDKTAKTILANFTSDRPANYVDCGLVTRKYRGVDPTEEYIYNLADPTTYIYVENGRTYDATVTSKLLAEIKAIVAEEGLGTNVTIEVNYTINKKTTAINQADSSDKIITKEEMKFTTSKPLKEPERMCQSIGALEEDILHVIN